MLTLSIACIKVAVFNSSLTDSGARAFVDSWVRQPDRDYAGKYSKPATRMRSLLGRCLVRALVDDVTETDGRRCRIDTEANGKPYIELESGESGPFVSVSHSGDLVAAAATDLGPLGIDIEYHRKDRPFRELAEFAYGPNERDIASVSRQAFYRIWTLREAMSKASGKGLAEAADRQDRVTDGLPFGAWETTDPSAPSGTRWCLAHVEPAPDYSMAFAVNRDAGSTTRAWSLESIEWLRPRGIGSGGSAR